MNSTKPERNAGIHRNRNVPFQTKNQNGTQNGFYNIVSFLSDLYLGTTILCTKKHNSREISIFNA